MNTAAASAFLPSARSPRPRAVSNWLLAVAALVFLMVVVGGITRLTESGLSMVRWEPVSGTVPPLNEEQWMAEFDAYKATPEYQKVNRGMSLTEFKSIFFWEYVHRLLGRFIGLAFALPLLWFAAKKAIPKGYGPRLTALLALGGLQGAIGWWMVASGLVDRPDVSHIRLAVHLLTALLILGGLVWTALDLRALDAGHGRAKMPTLGIWTLSVLALQMLFGAYVAGLNAGYAFNTWPLMGDALFPAETPMLEPALRNFVDNPVVVQFVHRWLAFAVAGFAVLLGLKAGRLGHKGAAHAVFTTVTVQILLGIATILTGVELWLGVAHQGMAALLLAAIVVAAHRIGDVPKALPLDGGGLGGGDLSARTEPSHGITPPQPLPIEGRG
ncbi:COX15/CtaA family protein [Allosphingosinicella flava]|uniref:Heme A synthase n=1 Tax=Allosphingosinicella flava TaxID=2771430 RepID=A0A7T2GJP0_9SPHN|nr:COX15/CtaA family protein [Sphingosinicella flava]QPQ55110.1 COX15/CtaA family protein [Sphingosinicella flava]